MRDYKLLVLGNLYSQYLVSFVTHLKAENPLAQIDYFGSCSYKELTPNHINCFRECHFVKASGFFNRIPWVRIFYRIVKWKISFSQFVKGRDYDIIQIHSPQHTHFFLTSEFKMVSHHIILSPWGSDVYRISNWEKYLLKRIYSIADYITVGNSSRFVNDVRATFSIPSQKLIHIGLGAEMIDYIMDHYKSISTNDAKKKLGIEKSYVITCGYNASMAQQHLLILDAIAQVRRQLPDNLVLLFPLTYSKTSHYINIIKEKVSDNHLKALYFEDFLDFPSLFVLRQATDMFIHVQTTDADNASLKEYLLCDKKVINGAWLGYDQLEIEGEKPYQIVNDMSSLSKAIMDSYLSKPKELSAPLRSLIVSQGGCREVAKAWNTFYSEITEFAGS